MAAVPNVERQYSLTSVSLAYGIDAAACSFCKQSSTPQISGIYPRDRRFMLRLQYQRIKCAKLRRFQVQRHPGTILALCKSLHLAQPLVNAHGSRIAESSSVLSFRLKCVRRRLRHVLVVGSVSIGTADLLGRCDSNKRKWVAS